MPPKHIYLRYLAIYVKLNPSSAFGASETLKSKQLKSLKRDNQT